MAVTLYTIGYERLLPAALVDELRAAGVERLTDVRNLPHARRAALLCLEAAPGHVPPPRGRRAPQGRLPELRVADL